MRSIRRSAIVPAAIVAIAAFTGGCVGENTPLNSAAQLVGAATSTPERKDFVAASRPEQLPYIPVGTSVTRPAKKLTPDEFKAIEADLDKERAQNEAEGAKAKAMGATPPPAPIKVR